MSGQRGRPQRLNVFGPCFAPYINDINKVSISSAAGGMERGWVWGWGGGQGHPCGKSHDFRRQEKRK